MGEFHVWAECHDPGRTELWKRIRPDGRLPVKPWPVWGRWRGEEFLAYVVDADLLTPEERERAARVLAEVHGLPVEEARRYVEEGRMLLRAEDVSVCMDQAGVAEALSMADMTGEWEDLWAEDEWCDDALAEEECEELGRGGDGRERGPHV